MNLSQLLKTEIRKMEARERRNGKVLVRALRRLKAGKRLTIAQLSIIDPTNPRCRHKAHINNQFVINGRHIKQRQDAIFVKTEARPQRTK